MSKEIKFPCCGPDTESLRNLSNDQHSDDEAISIFKKIAHPLRLKILRILVQHSEICSCELTQLFDESQPEVSRQLGILTSSGILVRRILTMKGISGRWHAYSIKQSRRQLIAHLIQPFTNIGI
jgi:DNA-binding transcriptional ArsR family regulator